MKIYLRVTKKTAKGFTDECSLEINIAEILSNKRTSKEDSKEHEWFQWIVDDEGSECCDREFGCDGVGRACPLVRSPRVRRPRGGRVLCMVGLVEVEVSWPQLVEFLHCVVHGTSSRDDVLC